MDNDYYKLPDRRPSEKPSQLAILSTLIQYRLKVYLKNKMFIFSTIIFPVFLSICLFIIFNKFVNGKLISYNSSSISIPLMYEKSLLNYETNTTFRCPSDENILSALNDKIDNFKNIQLNDIPLPKINELYYVSSIQCEDDNDQNFHFNVYYNDSMTHTLPASFNTISNSILSSKYITGKIQVKSNPYNNNDNMISKLVYPLFGAMIGFFFIFNINRFGSLIIYERINRLLHQLRLNGVSNKNYWISCFSSDIILYLICCILILCIGITVGFIPFLNSKFFYGNFIEFDNLVFSFNDISICIKLFI